MSLAILVALALAAQAPAVDGCATCHPPRAIERAHRAVAPKHAALTCASCHRGVSTATTAAAGHGAGGPDALLAGAETAASCASCHVVGIRGTEAVVRGIDVYLEQSCAICHRSLGLGLANAIGPPLDAIGLRDPDYLRQVLERPSRYYPGTPMPPYPGLFHSATGEGAALLVYLRTMRAKPRVSAGAEAAQPCASCHAGDALKNTKKGSKPGHDCVRIRAEAKAFDCARCHGREIPSGPGECLYVEGRLAECAACHEVPR